MVEEDVDGYVGLQHLQIAESSPDEDPKVMILAVMNQQVSFSHETGIHCTDLNTAATVVAGFHCCRCSAAISTHCHSSPQTFREVWW